MITPEGDGRLTVERKIFFSSPIAFPPVLLLLLLLFSLLLFAFAFRPRRERMELHLSVLDI